MPVARHHHHPQWNVLGHLQPIPSELLVAFECRDLPKGNLFSTPTNVSNQVFIVQSGRMRVYLAGKNRELTLSYLEAGDIFTTHTPAYIEAVVPAVLYLMDTGHFARKLASIPSISSTVMTVLGRLLVNTIGLVEDLAFRDVPARLARFLLAQVKRCGQECGDGWLIPLDLGMEDIACLLGTTRQTVSSLINQWERHDIVFRHGRHSLVVRSLAALGERCPDLVI